ncbi:MAG: hypothetical protein R3E86_02300 [Pseudomonadales bacterium]
MRYLVQMVIPALIFIGVVYLLSRSTTHKRTAEETESRRDMWMLALILVLGALVAIVAALALQPLWS